MRMLCYLLTASSICTFGRAGSPIDGDSVIAPVSSSSPSPRPDKNTSDGHQLVHLYGKVGSADLSASVAQRPVGPSELVVGKTHSGHAKEERSTWSPAEPLLLAGQRFATFLRQLVRPVAPHEAEFVRLGLNKGDIDVDVLTQWLKGCIDNERYVDFKFPPSAIETMKKYKQDPKDVVKALLSVKTMVSKNDGPDNILRGLAHYYRSDPKVMQGAWLDLEAKPKELFDTLKLGEDDTLKNSLYRATMWFDYTALLRSNKEINVLSEEEAVKLLVGGRDVSAMNTYIQKAKTDGVEVKTLADALINLYRKRGP
ncbi:unnamed protein product [Hyaloperonospora brassicae]|uniref:RxLR effector candidate protein n=1 Tax=Hyaloperonospora brassicae TaxID=162125 RepID=A0AAV0UHM8_HYABA|nr:unnamed protein product [Hyaloperonospora brassicae]